MSLRKLPKTLLSSRCILVVIQVVMCLRNSLGSFFFLFFSYKRRVIDDQWYRFSLFFFFFPSCKILRVAHPFLRYTPVSQRQHMSQSYSHRAHLNGSWGIPLKYVTKTFKWYPISFRMVVNLCHLTAILRYNIIKTLSRTWWFIIIWFKGKMLIRNFLALSYYFNLNN